MSAVKRSFSSKLRWLWLLPVLALGVAAAGYGWFESTRLDRTLAAVSDPDRFEKQRVEWQYLVGQRETPGVQAALRRLLADTMTWNENKDRWRTPDAQKRIKVLSAGLNASQLGQDQALLRDLTIVFLKFGLGSSGPEAVNGYDYSLLGDLAQVMVSDPAVTEIILDYAVGFFDRLESRYQVNDHAGHIARVLSELDRRGADADDRYLDAVARLAVLASIRDDQALLENLQARLSGFGESQRLSDALASAMIWGMQREFLSNLANLHLIIERLLRRPPVAKGDDYLSAILFHCVFWRATECAQLADRAGEDVPQRLRRLASSLDGETGRKLAEDLADQVVHWRAEGGPRPWDILKSLVALVPVHDTWQTFQKGQRSSRMTGEAPHDPFIDRAHDQLAGMGTEIHPILYRCLDTGNRVLVGVCAKILVVEDQTSFLRALGAQIDRFEPLAVAFAAGGALDARQYFYSGTFVAEGLRALASLDEPSFGPEFFFRALSLADPEYSKYASQVLRSWLDQNEFVDALFFYLARRESFLFKELAVYQTALNSFPDGSSAIERNLQSLLDAAGGKPERVFWILKVLGLESLAVIGRPSALPLIERYGSDRTQYVISGFRTVNGQYEETEERIAFSDLAVRASEAIRQREDLGE